MLFRSDRGKRVVQDQDLRLPHDGARERRALPLSSREGDAPFADDRVVPVGELCDVHGDLRDLRGIGDPVPGCGNDIGIICVPPFFEGTGAACEGTGACERIDDALGGCAAAAGRALGE